MALKEEKHFDFSKEEPVLKISTLDKDKSDEKLRYEQETAAYLEQYQIKMEGHMNREVIYRKVTIRMPWSDTTPE